MDRIDARLAGEHVEGGVETGFRDFDDMTGGLHNSEMIILAARPSMGKTALAMNIGQHVAIEARAPVLFVSLEMAADRISRPYALLTRQGQWPSLAERHDQ
jgi:replicative DNA helicase